MTQEEIVQTIGTRLTSEALQSPYIKVSKNSMGYNWDIKILGDDVKKIKRLSEEVEKEFPQPIKPKKAKKGKYPPEEEP